MADMGHWTCDMVSVRLANPADNFAVVHACQIWSIDGRLTDILLVRGGFILA